MSLPITLSLILCIVIVFSIMAIVAAKVGELEAAQKKKIRDADYNAGYADGYEAGLAAAKTEDR